MNRQNSQDRRRSQRIETRLPLNIAFDGYDLTTFTWNVSCTGAYCHINKYIPPFTKIAVRMNLPLNGGQADSAENGVECRGVVVRSVDEERGGFNIAIFFNEINENHKRKINRYVSKSLPASSS
ncbi:PilZ domain-containing protein [Candidatus Omnitrophota bacterium]